MIITKGHRSYAAVYIIVYLVAVSVLLHTLHWAHGNHLVLIIIKLCSYTLILFGGIWILALATIECMTIIMKPDGCTVRVFFWEKYHSWSSIYKPIYVHYRLFSSYWFTNHESECVLFSTKHTRMKQLNPDMSTFLARHFPFSLDAFYVEFHPRTKAITQSNPPIPKNPYCITSTEAECSFPVDREVFKQCMREWGVKIEGLDLNQDNQEVHESKPVGIFARDIILPSEDQPD